MNSLMQRFEAVFAAVAFAEQGEWDEARRIADGSLQLRETAEREVGTRPSSAARRPESRPRPRL